MVNFFLPNLRSLSISSPACLLGERERDLLPGLQRRDRAPPASVAMVIADTKRDNYLFVCLT